MSCSSTRSRSKFTSEPDGAGASVLVDAIRTNGSIETRRRCTFVDVDLCRKIPKNQSSQVMIGHSKNNGSTKGNQITLFPQNSYVAYLASVAGVTVFAVAGEGVDAVDTPAAILARVVSALVDVDLALGAGVTRDARAEIIILFVDARGTVHARA